MDEQQLTEQEFRLFRDLIHSLTGISLNEAKRQLVQSRLQKRLRCHRLSSFGDYYRMVTQDANDEETSTFINCITTNKTDFFREPHHFDFVAQKLIPSLHELVRCGERSPHLRVWHAGCSTGEEPYTLAMTLAEALAGLGTWDVRQLASDIDTQVLAHAERGVYQEDRVAPIPLPLQRKYLLRKRDGEEYLYKVKSCLSDQITFRQINLLEEWPMRSQTQFDLIFCRNVVIYFDKPTQKRLFARFQERLRPGGYLIIGHSETLLGISEAFESVGHTIYRLNDGSIRKAWAA